MAEPEANSTIDEIERVADRRDIALDDVSTVNSDEPGLTVRVLETDAESEVDQVGFQITKPSGNRGDQMFRRNLRQYFDALEDALRESTVSDQADQGDSDDDLDALEKAARDEDVDVDRSESSESAQIAQTPESDPRAQSSESDSAITEEIGQFTITASVEIDEGDLADITESIEDATQTLQEDIDDLDERISAIEDTFSQLGD